jgi:hypothetical protein
MRPGGLQIVSNFSCDEKQHKPRTLGNSWCWPGKRCLYTESGVSVFSQEACLVTSATMVKTPPRDHS